jgi:hypothetical protein
MRRAAEQSGSELQAEIGRVMDQLQTGAQPRRDQWPDPEILADYLGHEDRVVALMAAQLLHYQAHVLHIPMSPEIATRTDHVLQNASSLVADLET